MRDEFNLTPVPVTTGPGKMALSQAIDTSEYDVIIATLSVITGTGTPNVAVRLIGSMSKDSEDGWVELATFGALASFTATTLVIRGDKLLRYLRWEVTGTRFDAEAGMSGSPIFVDDGGRQGARRSRRLLTKSSLPKRS